jgi:hypothetical protein
VLCAPRGLGHSISFFKITAGAENAFATASQNDASPAAGLHADGLETSDQLETHRRIQCIRTLRAIHPDQQDSIFDSFK